MSYECWIFFVGGGDDVKKSVNKKRELEEPEEEEISTQLNKKIKVHRDGVIHVKLETSEGADQEEDDDEGSD